MRVNRVCCLLAISALTLINGCTGSSKLDLLNSAIPAVGYEKQDSVAYGEIARQRLDIYHPTEPSINSRNIVFIFGGAWRTGERAQYEFVGQSLSSAGHTVIIPDYRLYPQTTFPGFVDDIVAAIDKWTAIQDARVDNSVARTDKPLEIVLMGHSSGAHTAALLASDRRWLDPVGVAVTDLIALSGPYDLPLDNSEVAPVFADAPADRVKPANLATACHPRTLLLHGTDDERVLPKHSRTYARALQDLDVEVDLVLLEGASHAAPIASLAAPLQFTSDSYAKVTQFLSKVSTPVKCE